MKSSKIDFWARIGQNIIFIWFALAFLANLSASEVLDDSTVAKVVSLLFIISVYIILEAIVRIITYFAEILEGKNENNSQDKD